MTPSECIRKLFLPCSLEGSVQSCSYLESVRGHAINLEQEEFEEGMEAILTEFGQCHRGVAHK